MLGTEESVLVSEDVLSISSRMLLVNRLTYPLSSRCSPDHILDIWALADEKRQFSMLSAKSV